MIISIINSIAIAIIILHYARKKIEKKNKRNMPQKIQAGKYSYAASSSFDNICSHPDTKIGKFCSIAGGVKIGPSEHPINYLSTHGFQYEKNCCGFENDLNVHDVKHLTKPCVIGHDVWIGQDAIIKAGITIGHGAIIGCGAVVTKNVPPYSIVAGVPAKIIRYRFSSEIIEELLRIQWWDYPEDIIEDLPFSDINKCIEILKIYKNVKSVINKK